MPRRRAFVNSSAPLSQRFGWNKSPQHHSPKQCIQRISQRIKWKRQNGQRLTATELYLGRRIPQLKKKLLAPSKFSVLGEILQVFIQPLPIMLILGLILASEVSSKASYFRQGMPDDQSLIVKSETGIELGERGEAVAPKEASIPRLAKLTPRTPSEQRGLIEFISGVITVYTPSISDPGLIAREVVRLSIEEKVDPLYVAAIIAAESSFRTHARSRVGALGLMQLIPRTARAVAKREIGHSKGLRLTEPSINIKLGICYLKELEQRYRGNRYLALSAYNWGLNNVAKAQKKGRRFPKSVRRYSTKILETTLRWQKQYARTSKNARAFEESLYEKEAEVS